MNKTIERLLRLKKLYKDKNIKANFTVIGDCIFIEVEK